MANPTKILAFCCNWCSYAAADLAGAKRIQYPADVHIIRVMCSGMVHPQHVIDSLYQGADGVMILGCHLGECHYLKGNYLALDRADAIAALLDDFGFEQERFTLDWVSAAEPDRFAQLIHKMCESINRLTQIEFSK